MPMKRLLTDFFHLFVHFLPLRTVTKRMHHYLQWLLVTLAADSENNGLAVFLLDREIALSCMLLA